MMEEAQYEIERSRDDYLSGGFCSHHRRHLLLPDCCGCLHQSFGRAALVRYPEDDAGKV